ncbi:response regulator receiver modulated metal dependent phosphohydrolase [Malonomonas rubra DSM 5091]|uniref:Response regulator receiver modulated metal dependent phosphohydrolase n=1 Tax=Malonomonas rubra DSM 5091 TaxID=1122189 RepID=A0A1M6DI44_MALRU|nr:HD domain-containing phosphohydrolase [Malonomonas rubra]SHI72984.1 response regulator receiver modulated metal dependent phosphohydrolase [Malonomonas rubra DSM 5091]
MTSNNDLDDLVLSSSLSDIHNAKILIVDDNPSNVALLEAVLEEDEYENIYTTTDPFQVLPLYMRHRFDLILLDIRMPGMSGIEVLGQFADIMQEEYLPIIVLTAQTDQETRQQALSAGAKDFLTKPFEDWEVLLRIRNTLQTRLYYTRQVIRADLLESEVRERTNEIRRTQFEIVRRLGAAGELRDNETGAHVQRMSHTCSLLAAKRGLGQEFSELLLHASTMHDVGKIGIPDDILLKPGKLTDDEWVLMREHPRIGARIIGDNPSKVMQLARETALYHHEKWDGSGYPNGISGEQIPIAARIAAVSDVFDALTSERPYKHAWPVEKAVTLLKEESGKHFEPVSVDLFIDNLPEILQIKDRFLDQETFNSPAPA